MAKNHPQPKGTPPESRAPLSAPVPPLPLGEAPTSVGGEGVPAEIVVARIASAHGTTGEVAAEAMSEVAGRFDKGSVLRLNGQPRRIERFRRMNKLIALKLEGIDSAEDAKRYHGANLTVFADKVPPPPANMYYHYQLIDMDVFTVDGERLGRLTEILSTGANDVYIVRPDDGPDLLLPATADVVRAVDVAARRMTVELIPGLR